jgi:peptide/nickel transport system permease protein
MAGEVATPTAPPRASPGLLSRTSIGGRLLRRPAAVVSLIIVLIFLAIAAFAPVIAPHDPDAIGVASRFAPPGDGHLLGTDYLGRDLLSRTIHGARIATLVAFPAVLAGFVVGLALGLVAGYVGGIVDQAMTIVFDAILAMPAVILGLALLTLLGPSLPNTIILIATAFLPWYGRLARAQTLAAKQNPYVKAERSLGASRARILALHILPNIVPPLLILMAMDIPAAIGVAAGLAFLGLGVQPPTADWGVMLSDAFGDVRVTAWPLAGPLAALIVVTAAFTVLGETLRDLTDPKHVQGRRRRLMGGLRKT